MLSLLSFERHLTSASVTGRQQQAMHQNQNEQRGTEQPLCPTTLNYEAHLTAHIIIILCPCHEQIEFETFNGLPQPHTI